MLLASNFVEIEVRESVVIVKLFYEVEMSITMYLSQMSSLCLRGNNVELALGLQMCAWWKILCSFFMSFDSRHRHTCTG